MATHSSVLAWRIPGMAEPGGLQSVGVAQSRTRLKRLSSSSSSSREPGISQGPSVREGLRWNSSLSVPHQLCVTAGSPSPPPRATPGAPEDSGLRLASIYRLSSNLQARQF